MAGAKNLCAQAQQHGEGNIEDGSRPLTWALYSRFNEYFLMEGTEEGVFGKAFSTLCVNLAARGKSTAQVCTKHMKWSDDCMHVAFAHIKDAQDGSNTIKKLPCSIYCNPLTHSNCPLAAIFDYMALSPDIISNPEESFFSGSLSNQSQRFGRLVKRIIKKHIWEVKNVYGFKIEDIGVHSWRKCAHTTLNCGSTAGPSAAASCI